MQARVALVVSAALFVIVGSTVANRFRPAKNVPDTIINEVALQTPTDLPEVGHGTAFEKFGQNWSVTGTARGKLKFYDGEGNYMGEIDYTGPGTTDTVTVEGQRLERNATNGTMEAHPVEKFPLRLNTNHVVRYPGRRAWASVIFIPFTDEEERKFKAEERAAEERLRNFYQNPACITLDTKSHMSMGEFQLPGLIGVNLDSFREGNFAPRGLALKIYGDAKVILKVTTSGQPYITDCESAPTTANSQRLFARTLAAHPELTRLVPKSGEPPVLYWYESGDTRGERPAGTFPLMGYSEHLVNDDGTWHKVKRSGKATGYGSHIIRGVQGKPMVVVEILPRK